MRMSDQSDQESIDNQIMNDLRCNALNILEIYFGSKVEIH